MRAAGYYIKGNRGLGAPDGGAAFQINVTTDALHNADTWDFGLVELSHYRIRNAQQEGEYLNYNSDGLQSGFAPIKITRVIKWRFSTDTCGNDGNQFTGVKYMEQHDFRVSNVGLRGFTSHNSAFSHNDGNEKVFIYRFKAWNFPQFRSGQNGISGVGGAYHYFSYWADQGTFSAATPNQAVFDKVESQNCDFHDVNFTLICETVNTAAFTIQHDNVSTFKSLYMTKRGGVIVSAGTDRPNPPGTIWINRISTPSPTTGWDTSGNVFRRPAQKSELKIDANGRPNDITSLIFGAGFDWSTLFPSTGRAETLPGGQYDLEGYSLNVPGVGYSAGGFCGQELLVTPIVDNDPPVFSSTSIDEVTSGSFRVNAVCDETATVFFVVVPDGQTAPSVAQVIAGLNGLGTAPLKSGNATGSTTNQTVTGLAASTAHDVYMVARDSHGNTQVSTTKKDQTTSGLSAFQVLINFVDAADMIGSGGLSNGLQWNQISEMLTPGTKIGNLKDVNNNNTGIEFNLIANLSGESAGGDGLSLNTGTSSASDNRWPDVSRESQ